MGYIWYVLCHPSVCPLVFLFFFLLDNKINRPNSLVQQPIKQSSFWNFPSLTKKQKLKGISWFLLDLDFNLFPYVSIFQVEVVTTISSVICVRKFSQEKGYGRASYKGGPYKCGHWENRNRSEDMDSDTDVEYIDRVVQTELLKLSFIWLSLPFRCWLVVGVGSRLHM